MSVTINGRKATMKEEKQLAVEMWEFVRVCQTELCVEDDSLSLKRRFISMKLKCGIDIKWHDDCFLCEHSCSCLDCPLYKIGGDMYCSDDDSPFDITMSPKNHPYYKIDEAIDKIIHAMEVFNE
jgi:hypothetical protein